MHSEQEEAVVLEPPGTPRAAVLWLHGLGADGHDFVPIVPELGLPPDHGIRFIFPHAPVRPVTLNNGFPMRAWYDIYGLDRPSPQDEEGIRASAARVQAYLETQKQAGIPAERIVLAGFSQGGAMTLHTGLRHPERLAGLLALSTYLPLAERLDEVRPERRDTPVFMAHGRQDPIVPQSLGEMSRDLLRQRGYEVDWRSYPMQHQVCMEEIRDLAAWLRSRLD